jgi:MFS family permease
LLPVYLRDIGYNDDATGLLLGGAVLGGIVAQVPLAWLADRFGKRPIAYGCVASTALGLWVLPSCVAVVPLLGWLFVVGAGGSAFYPLGLAIMSERVQPAARGRASAWFLGVNCLGSLVGPAVTGAAMDQFGRPSLFVVAAASVSAILVVWTASVLVRFRAGHSEIVQSVAHAEVRRAA